jgi:predicted dienelactone hydrolase
VLASQNHSYFLMWGGFEKGAHNTAAGLRALYANPRTLTQGRLPLSQPPTAPHDQLSYTTAYNPSSMTAGVRCDTLPIPSLVATFKAFRAARVCAPADGGAYPLHVLAHGNGGGGPMAVAYHSLQEQLASHGFVVALYLSCAWDSECANGEASFLEVLKTIEALLHAPSAAAWEPRILPGAPFTASGHSTGARAVLMLAALRDSPAFLQNTSLGAQVTQAHRQLLRNLTAVVADHADPMADPQQDPDRPHYHVTRTAVACRALGPPPLT